MVLEIWDVVKINETGETGLVIGHRSDGRIAVSVRDRQLPKLIGPLGLTRQLSG